MFSAGITRTGRRPGKRRVRRRIVAQLHVSHGSADVRRSAGTAATSQEGYGSGSEQRQGGFSRRRDNDGSSYATDADRVPAATAAGYVTGPLVGGRTVAVLSSRCQAMTQTLLRVITVKKTMDNLCSSISIVIVCFNC